MELKQLEYFIAIAEEGTISSAARKLNMTQPPLSLCMKHLEEELGVTLFVRGTRQITLTEQGRIFYRYAEEMLEMQESTLQAVRELKPSAKPIRLGLISSFDSALFYQNAKALRDKYPDQTFRITEGNTYDLLDLLQKGKLDLAAIRTPYQEQNLEAVELSVDYLAAAGTGIYEELLHKEITLDDLEGIPLIIYRRWERVIREAFGISGITPRIFSMNDDARTCLQWARHEMGIALVPVSILHVYDDLKWRKVHDIQIETHLRLVKLKGRCSNERAEDFYQSFLKL